MAPAANPQLQTCREAQFSMPAIFAARPLAELKIHLKNHQTPSRQLVARCTKVIALALFTWHFYDHLLLLRPEALVHSLQGRVEIIYKSGIKSINNGELPLLYFSKQNLENFEKKFPYLLKCAHYYKVIEHRSSHQVISHRWKYLKINHQVAVKIPEFVDYKKINANSLFKYFKKYHHLNLTDGSSISKILKSKYVSRINVIDV